MAKSPFGPGRPSKQDPPAAPGVYRWRNKKTREIEDIGEASDLKRRKAAKEWDPATHDFEWKQANGRSTDRTRREVEKTQIDRHRPIGNTRRGGGGRRPSR